MEGERVEGEIERSVRVNGNTETDNLFMLAIAPYEGIGRTTYHVKCIPFMHIKQRTDNLATQSLALRA